MSLFWRYNLALMGGFLAMSAHVFLSASRNIWFTPQHLGNAMSAGLMFGHVVAIMVVVVRDVPTILRDKLPIQIIWLVSIVGGITLGTLAWWVHVTLTLYQKNPDWWMLVAGGVSLAIGFFISATLGDLLKSDNVWQRLKYFIQMVGVTTLFLYPSIYIVYQNYLETLYDPIPAQALLYFQADNPEHVWLIGLPFALTIAIFGQLAVLFQSSSSHPAEP